MWLVFLLLILVLGILYSKIEISLYSIDITDNTADFNEIISLKIFGLLKILKIRFNKYGIQVLNKRISYKSLLSNKNLKKINKQSLKTFERLNISFDKVDFKMKLGLIDMSLTNSVIVVFSSVFPNLIKNRVNMKNLSYEVLPDYKNFCIKLEGKISLSIRTLTLVKIYFKNIKSENEHNKNKNYRVKESY